MPCPGSVTLSEGQPDSTSEYADEGTAAHELGAWCLRDGSHPVAYIGRILHVVNGTYWPGGDAPLPPRLFGVDYDIRREFEVDVEFAGHVNAYVQRVREHAAGNTLLVEQELPIGHITGEEGATGKGDAVILVDSDDEIQVHDLKFGMGRQKYAEKNPQLLFYSAGALFKYQDIGNYKRFRVFIHQPRLNHVDEWDFTLEELKAFEAEAKAAAAVVNIASEHRDSWLKLPPEEQHYLQPSEDACFFCKANAICPKSAKQVLNAVSADDFEDLEARRPGAATHYIPVDYALLGQKLRAIDFIETWCKAVRGRVEAALFETNNDPIVQTALGQKLVEGRRGARAWSDTEQAEAVLKKMRFKVEEMYTMKVITPPAAEKLMADQPKRWAKLQPLITQADGRPSVAPLSDKRPPLVLKPAADDFVDLDKGEDLV